MGAVPATGLEQRLGGKRAGQGRSAPEGREIPVEAYRLKKIVILILIFLNLFLLGMLGRQLWQERSAQYRLEQELRQLYAGNEMALAEDVSLVPPPPDRKSVV